MRVLVIEDNADLREYLRVALEAQEYEVLTAAHGHEALAYLNATLASLRIKEGLLQAPAPRALAQRDHLTDYPQALRPEAVNAD